jgi:hypothetical protein
VRYIAASLFTRAIIAAMILKAGEARAQTVLITEPTEWRSNRAVVLVPGRAVRIAGSVSYPGGIAKVLVNGGQALLRADDDDPNFILFERTLEAGSIGPVVTIAFEAPNGVHFERRYSVTTSNGAPAADVMVSNPWRPLRLRAIAYVAVAAGGVALALASRNPTTDCRQVGGGTDCFQSQSNTAYEVTGYAVAGAAAAAFLIDAIITAHRADAAPAQSASTQRSRLELFPLSITPSPSSRGAKVELVRFNPWR